METLILFLIAVPAAFTSSYFVGRVVGRQRDKQYEALATSLARE